MVAHSCSPSDLAAAIPAALNGIYGEQTDFDPPLPHVDTWVLGLRVKDKAVVDEQALPAWRRRCRRLNFSDYTAFDEDFPVYEDTDDSKPRGKLSRAAVMTWMQQFAEFLGDVTGAAAPAGLFEFTDRPEGYPGPRTHSVPDIVSSDGSWGSSAPTRD